MIPSTIESISRYAFYLCSSLEEICFPSPSRVSWIGHFAFPQCSSLESIRIPASVVCIDSSAFVDSAIARIDLEQGSTSFVIHDHLLLDSTRRSVIPYFGRGSSVTIPSCVVGIYPYGFCLTASLHEISFESDSQLVYICTSAF
jgi:hypothetical protein